MKAGHDGQGTVLGVQRIVTGLAWKAVAEPLLVVGSVQDERLAAGTELGATVAGGLSLACGDRLPGAAPRPGRPTGPVRRVAALEPDLRNVHAFFAVVDEGGFTGAGRRLRLSQQGLTDRIRRLEQVLSAQLLTRTTGASS